MGVSVVEVCRQAGITEQTFYRWNCNWPLLSLAKMTWALIQPAAGATKGEGVGDYAVYWGDADLMNPYVKKGNVELSINVHGFPLDQLKEKEETLAKALLGNL